MVCIRSHLLAYCFWSKMGRQGTFVSLNFQNFEVGRKRSNQILLLYRISYTLKTFMELNKFQVFLPLIDTMYKQGAEMFMHQPISKVSPNDQASEIFVFFLFEGGFSSPHPPHNYRWFQFISLKQGFVLFCRLNSQR